MKQPTKKKVQQGGTERATLPHPLVLHSWWPAVAYIFIGRLNTEESYIWHCALRPDSAPGPGLDHANASLVALLGLTARCRMCVDETDVIRDCQA